MIKSFISIISFVLAGVVFFMYTESAYSNTKVLQANIERYNQALEKTAELKKLQETLLSRFNAFSKNDIERLHKLLPDHVDNVRLILDLDHLAGTFGMALQNVTISDQTVIGSIGAAKQKYDSLTLKFTTHGTYANFIAFMESLESSLRIVDLVALSLSPETQSGDSSGAKAPEASYKYDITVRTYWLR